ncbi:MAG: cytochrome c biogenesis protein ResB [Propionibacteriaceae bacterium]|nr:cytochrome c biogenesis protein ResB [Propionibacteriaceae bacterium]
MTSSDTDIRPDQASVPEATSLPTQSSLAESEDLPVISIGQFFQRLYQVTYSKTIGLIIILVTAVFVFIGMMLTQAPSGTWSDPAGRDQFMSMMHAKYGAWATLLGGMGFFHVFTSIPFFIVMAALAISIAGCTSHRIPQMWQQWRHPRVLVSERFFTAARYQASVPTSGKDDQALHVVQDKLKAAHYRVIRGNDTSLYADKYSWGGFGTVAAHLSFIIIMAAFVVSGLTGYQGIVNVFVGGSPVSVGDKSGLTLEAPDFNATYDDTTGRPLDYVSHLILRDGDTVVAEQDVRVNSPMTYKGFAFHQNNYGMGVDVSVKDSSGNTLFSGAVPQPYTSTDKKFAIGEFTLPDLGLVVQVLSPVSGTTNADIGPGQLGFAIFRDGESDAMATSVVDQGTSATVRDLTLSFVREGQFTGIMVRQDPGATWMWIGSILLVVGMTVTFTFRHRRLWVRAQDGKLLLASADKEDSGFREHFNQLVSQAQTWFSVRSK